MHFQNLAKTKLAFNFYERIQLTPLTVFCIINFLVLSNSSFEILINQYISDTPEDVQIFFSLNHFFLLVNNKNEYKSRIKQKNANLVSNLVKHKINKTVLTENQKHI